MTLSVTVPPLASVAARRSDRVEGYSWSGATNEPDATPANWEIVCSWQVEGQWFTTSVQVSADAGRAWPSVSVAPPAKLTRSPTAHVVAVVGVEIWAAAGTEALPPHVRRASAQSPWSAVTSVPPSTTNRSCDAPLTSTSTRWVAESPVSTGLA